MVPASFSGEVTRNGQTTTYSYNLSGQLSTISNAFGRSLALTYNGIGQVLTVTVQRTIRTVTYGYDSQWRYLRSTVTYPRWQGSAPLL